MNNNRKITWKYVPVVTTAPDGTKLKGVIRYWAKQYTVILKEPFEAKDVGSHLMYLLPAIFITDEASRQGTHDIDLSIRAKEILISLYESKK